MTGSLRHWIQCRLESLVIAFLCLFAGPVIAAELYEDIDREIAQAAGGKVSGPAKDGEFLRRTYLTLAGTIPSRDQAVKFLEDASPDKRRRLIDSLLESPTFPRRMEEAFSAMLLERRIGTLVPPGEWSAFLRKSFEENRPWDQLVREILSADGRDPGTQGAVKFFADGGRANPDVMTRDVARLFLGMDLQCAQCHDHPVIRDYKQADYFGLQAFLKATKALPHPETKVALLSEDVVSMKLEFESVFIPGKQQTGPRILQGKEFEIPQFDKGQEWEVMAAEGVPGIPKFRLRQQLAKELASSSNSQFVRNSVNRIWFLMMGRGIVHPLDLDHSENPPSHPELLRILGEAFVANQMDVKWLVRQIAYSETFQRSSELPDGLPLQDVRPEKYQVAIARPLSPEQLTWAILDGTGTTLPTEGDGKTSFAVGDYLSGKTKTPPANITESQQLMVTLFGNAPGEAEVDFNPSRGAALFLMNETFVLQMLKKAPGNFIDRLSQLKDEQAVATELYVGLLSRMPSDEERSDVKSYLQKHDGAREEALGDLAWSLMASAEFRLNH